MKKIYNLMKTTPIKDIPVLHGATGKIRIIERTEGKKTYIIDIEHIGVLKISIPRSNVSFWENAKVGEIYTFKMNRYLDKNNRNYGMIIDTVVDDGSVKCNMVKVEKYLLDSVQEKPIIEEDTLVGEVDKVEKADEVPAKEPTFMVSVTEEVLVKQSVDIDIYTLTDKHLKDMNRLALMNVIKFLIAAHNGTAQEFMDSGNANLIDDDYIDTEDAERECGSGSNTNTFDRKIGKTSKYKYVFYDKHRNKWKWQVEKKTGSSVSEEIAALFVDEYLDSIQDDKRTRNRDEFPEIMHIYSEAKKSILVA